MRFRQLPLITILLTAALVIGFASCGKERKPAESKAAAPAAAQALQATETPAQTPAEGASPAKKVEERFDKLGFLLKDVEKFPSDEKSCRAFCKVYCPHAAKCRIGALSKIQRCKPLCFDPCMKKIFPKNFVECTGKAADCNELRECAKEFILLIKGRTKDEMGEGDAAKGTE